jgi:hypothetical protein
VRVVGYVRESADPSAGRSAFEQQEIIRRHAAEQGHALVAICQDARSPGAALGRDGYLGLLGVVASGAVDGILVAGVGILSSDQIVQEIMLWDLRGRGVRIISTDPTDLSLLDSTEEPGPSRMLIRDVLERVGEHARSLGSHRLEPPAALPDGDVMIHILAADRAEAEGAPTTAEG